MAGDEGIDGIVITQTRDAGLISEILNHPSIKRHVTDDSGSVDPTEAALSPHCRFLLAHYGEELLGMFFVHSHTLVMYEAHVCMLPAKRWTVEAGKALTRWVFFNTPCKRLIAFVPANNRLALSYAKRCGMKVDGVVKSSFMKNGSLQDQYLLSIGAEE